MIGKSFTKGFSFGRRPGAVVLAGPPILSSLLHFDGLSGSTDIIDETGKIWTATGAAAISTAASKFGGASLFLDGDGDAVYTGASTDFDVAGENLTVEFFMRVASSGDSFGTIIANRANLPDDPEGKYPNWSIGVNARRLNVMFADQTSGLYGTPVLDLQGVTQLAASTWHHIALTKSGLAAKLYVNGTLYSSGTMSGAPKADMAVGKLVIGADYMNSTSSYYRGYVDELRIKKNEVVYTDTFTPPAGPFTVS